MVRSKGFSLARTLFFLLAFCVAGVGAAVAGSSGAVCQAAYVQQLQEMKLSVSTAGFEDKEAFFDSYWQVVRAAAVEQGLHVIDTSENKIRQRIIRYYDTEKGFLKQNNLILRQRIKVKNGEPEEESQLTLKYRRPVNTIATVEPAAAEKLVEKVKGNDDYKPYANLEYDVVGYSEGKLGNNKAALSASCSVSGVPSDELGSMGDAAVYFPKLRDMGVSDSLSLGKLGGMDIKEYSFAPGVIDLADSRASISLSCWVDPIDGKPLTCELSWRGAVDSAQTMSLFNLVQERLQDKLVAGKNKTALLLE